MLQGAYPYVQKALFPPILTRIYALIVSVSLHQRSELLNIFWGLLQSSVAS